MQPQRRQISLSSGELTYFMAGEGRPIVYLHPAGGGGGAAVPGGVSKAFCVFRPGLAGVDGAKPPRRRAVEQEAANRRMLPHYRAPDDPDAELLAKIASIDKLTLILHGTADRMIPKESVQLLKRRMPRAYLVYVWDAAHAIEVDQPERMLAVLGSFLERSEGFMVNWGTLAVNPG